MIEQITNQTAVSNEEMQVANEMFPNDLSSLKIISNKICSSTGAKLVEDEKRNRYIMKRGDAHPQNTSNDHVINEYICNQLYNISGIKIPKCQLYFEGGMAILLSSYISNARPIRIKDYPAIAKIFLYDCLFANWDAYTQNDNCLVDSYGNLIHVDNGGTLNFRAKGGIKPFDGNIMDTFCSMQRYSPFIALFLDDNNLLKQIADIRIKRAPLVNYLTKMNRNTLAKTIEERIDNLYQIEQLINQKQKKRGKFLNYTDYLYKITRFFVNILANCFYVR